GRPVVPTTPRDQGRVLHTPALRDRRAHECEQHPLYVATLRLRRCPRRDAVAVARTDPVAALFTRWSPYRLCFVRAEATAHLHAAHRYRAARANHQLRRPQWRPCVLSGWQSACIRAVEGWQSRGLCHGPWLAPASAPDQSLRDRYRAVLGC